jgi:hypothetical protein
MVLERRDAELLLRDFAGKHVEARAVFDDGAAFGVAFGAWIY